MAVPSRVYVGVTVFGAIATLLTVPYAIMLLTGVRPPALSPLLSFEAAAEPAFIVFIVVAGLLSIGLTWFAWRALVHGARRDARRRRARDQVVRQQRQYRRQRPPQT